MVPIESRIAAALEAALNKMLSKAEISRLIEVPPQPELGDYAFPCFRVSPLLKRAPNEIAVKLSKEIALPRMIEKAVPAGPYLNFFVSREWIAGQTILAILRKRDGFGRSKIGRGKRVMVEYSSPNTNKPLHVGHLRNGSIGMAASNLLEAVGHRVIKANLINDRGIHICQSMLAYKKWGEGKKPDKKADHFVGDYYVLFNEKAKKDPSLEAEARLLLRKWENKDREAIALWREMNKWAISGFRETYRSFGTSFDVWFRESEFYDKAKPILEKGMDTGVFFENDDGAIVAMLEPLLPNKVVQRADGTSIYITNDLALTKHKFEKFALQESIWVVGSEQNLYFKQLFKIFELLGFRWAGKCRHLSYGMVYLPHGRMKSREGKVVDADNLIEQMEGLAEKEIRKRYRGLPKGEVQRRAKAIALAAIKFFMLRTSEARDIYFNPEESISFEGETGPYLQYTFARAKSILRKAKRPAQDKKANCALLTAEAEKQLVMLLHNFPAVIEKAALALQPHLLAQHLIETAAAFNSFYHSLPVLKAETKELASARLALVQSVAIVLGNGLKLLGIRPIERM
jgi:arginyl-tRNA synthetase